ncbi:MAG: DUF883 family protein [Phycisphaeraceae bacterium]|nr:DUF883 family protein [Phycisphaeraceae bacterium]
MTTSSHPAKASRSDEADLRNDLDSIKGDLVQLRVDFNELLRDASGVVKSRVHSAVDTAVAAGKENVHTLEKRIEERPLMAVGIALGVGALIGFMLRR